ncbi:hypothetical protein AB0M39_09530 [Streptomyces sp. NPDC051907]|uniref:hypothetical protein n=1 Tax=Streptomyces sp. NPDC051907 TaxID=3155284 RepID=UPI003422F915
MLLPPLAVLTVLPAHAEDRESRPRPAQADQRENPRAVSAEERESPRPTPTAKPTAASSLAGRPAGEGRPRPGRKVPREGDADRSRGPSAKPGRASDSPTRSAPPSGSASRPASASTTPSRTRPPEPEAPLTEDEALEEEAPAASVAPPTPTPIRTVPAAARDQGPQALPQPVRHQISPLSLGVGMALMGLGIGFLGVRLRRR